jgi:hypothetical protein
MSRIFKGMPGESCSNDSTLTPYAHRYQTCRSLWSLTHSKVLWYHLLECARWYRPIKLPAPMHEISVDVLRESIVKSMKLDHVLAKRYLVDPVRVWEFAPAADNIRRLAGSGEPEHSPYVTLTNVTSLGPRKFFFT